VAVLVGIRVGLFEVCPDVGEFGRRLFEGASRLQPDGPLEQVGAAGSALLGCEGVGVQSSVAMGKSKLAGITPITRKFWSSSRMVFPTMVRRRQKRRRQSRSLRINSRSRPGWSSPA